MKLKLFVILLTGIMLMSFTACESGSAQSAAPIDIAAAEEEEDNTPSIPAAVYNLSAEDDILLNGNLKDNVYVNDYFGLKFTAPDGMKLSRLNDGATDSTEIIPLMETYESGYDGIMINTALDAEKCVFITICALEDEKAGMTEDEVVRSEINATNELVEAFGLEGCMNYVTTVLAGEEHPAALNTSEPDCADMYLFIVKNGFEYKICITAPDEQGIEELIAYFEKA